MTRLISIGDRGTAFADLDAQQLKSIQKNTYNFIPPNRHRTDEQERKGNACQHTGDLWTDACCFVTITRGPRATHPKFKVWIGEKEVAISQNLIWKAKVSIGGDAEPLVGYLRHGYDGALPLPATHKYIAVDTPLGRIEPNKIKRRLCSEAYRNSPVVKKVTFIAPSE